MLVVNNPPGHVQESGGEEGRVGGWKGLEVGEEWRREWIGDQHRLFDNTSINKHNMASIAAEGGNVRGSRSYGNQALPTSTTTTSYFSVWQSPSFADGGWGGRGEGGGRGVQRKPHNERGNQVQ